MRVEPKLRFVVVSKILHLVRAEATFTILQVVQSLAGKLLTSRKIFAFQPLLGCPGRLLWALYCLPILVVRFQDRK